MILKPICAMGRCAVPERSRYGSSGVLKYDHLDPYLFGHWTDYQQLTSIPRDKYGRFLDEVTTVCNEYMHEAPSTWRERFRITYLDRVEAMALELAKDQQEAIQLAPGGQNTPISPELNSHGSVWSQAVGNSRAIMESSSSTPIWSSESSTPSSHWTVGHSSVRSPQSPCSPMSFPSPVSIDNINDITYCKSCDTPFTGLLQDRNSNLKRHMRYKHGNMPRINCTIEGCTSNFPRQDALQKHMRTVHQKPSRHAAVG